MLYAVCAGRSSMDLFTCTAKLDPGAHGARCAWAKAVHHPVGISRQRNSGYRPSRVNIMEQGLSTPDPSLSPTHLSIRRGRATTTHSTHNQVSNTTLVPSLGLHIGPACKAGFNAGAKGASATPKKKERVKAVYWNKCCCCCCLWVFELFASTRRTDGQTDRQRDEQKQRLLPLSLRAGHNNQARITEFQNATECGSRISTAEHSQKDGKISSRLFSETNRFKWINPKWISKSIQIMNRNALRPTVWLQFVTFSVYYETATSSFNPLIATLKPHSVTFMSEVKSG